MLEGTRPIDLWMLVIELLVLLLIAGEGITGIIHWRRKNSATKHLLKMLCDGQQLHDSAPHRTASQDAVEAWNEEVDKWFVLVQDYLVKKSEAAVVVFCRCALSQRYSLRISERSTSRFYELDSRLKNLQSIMEKPDVYF